MSGIAWQALGQNKQLDRLTWLSIVLPCHNEEKSIQAVVVDALRVGHALAERLEVVVVNDGSSDGSAAVLGDLQRRHAELRVVTHEQNRGYGAALRSGFTSAEADYIFYTDADGQFRLDDLSRALPVLRSHDIAVGYRAGRQDPWFRRLAGSLWTGLMNRCFALEVRDVNCAFKVFPRELFAQIDIESEGALVDAEVLAKARALGMRIGEFPVVHFPRVAGQQSGTAPRVVLRACQELSQMIRQRRNH